MSTSEFVYRYASPSTSHILDSWLKLNPSKPCILDLMIRNYFKNLIHKPSNSHSSEQLLMAEDPNQENTQQQQHVVSIQEDILESIFTHLPLLDLVSAYQVSRSWKRTVLTSLSHSNKIKPWLFIYTQSSRSPSSITTHAYDPRSSIWLQIHYPSINLFSPIRSSHSTLLYVLSPSEFSFSLDPMHLIWHRVDPPVIWRTDPIVVLVAHRLIVVGGASHFEDDPLAMEIYDMKTRMWETSSSIPTIFKDSSASMWFSIAVNHNKLYILEKNTGMAFWFNPETQSWFGPRNLCRNVNVSMGFIGFSNDCLIMIGLIRDKEETFGRLKLWEVNSESIELSREIGEMPESLLEKLRGEDSTSCMSSIIVKMMGELMFIVNTWAPEEVFICQLEGRSGRWSSVPNVVVNDKWRLSESLVFTCGDVGLKSLYRATVADNTKFSLV